MSTREFRLDIFHISYHVMEFSLRSKFFFVSLTHYLTVSELAFILVRQKKRFCNVYEVSKIRVLVKPLNNTPRD